MKSKIEVASDVKARIEAVLFKIPGVNAVDVGYKYVKGERTDEISIRVHVTQKKKDVPPEELIPSEVEGIKTDVIEGYYEAQADAMKYRPLWGGISVGSNRIVGGSWYGGTLGCMVLDLDTRKIMMLSNFHVLCIDGSWHAGDQMDQPALIEMAGTFNVGSLNRAVLTGYVDGAVANIDPLVDRSWNIAGIGVPMGTAEAELGSNVRKRGRTTLLTYGYVDGINATVNVPYGFDIGTKTLTNQIFIRPYTEYNSKFSDHGDSGSVVVDEFNRVIGLLFAGASGTSLANPIAEVERELNIRVWYPIFGAPPVVEDPDPGDGSHDDDDDDDDDEEEDDDEDDDDDEEDDDEDGDDDSDDPFGMDPDGDDPDGDDPGEDQGEGSSEEGEGEGEGEGGGEEGGDNGGYGDGFDGSDGSS